MTVRLKEVIHLGGRGWRSEIGPAPYEFERGGNETLRIGKDDHPPRFAASRET